MDFFSKGKEITNRFAMRVKKSNVWSTTWAGSGNNFINPIIIYMKGTPQFPQCGFSARAASALQACNVEFAYVNVLADPEAFSLFESCGARIIEDDLCTGSRLFTPLENDGNKDPVLQISRGLMTRPPCARTFDPAQPLKMADDILRRAQASGARGAIGQTIKFCDPYLDRLPLVRETLRQAGIPLLLLEGDCSLGSIEQQRTRIEAFIEMLV